MNSRRERLASIERQVDGFEQSRQARQNECDEDYVELIADLIASDGEARGVDLAKRLGVSHTTVNGRLNRLQQRGLVNFRPYRSVFLTPQGEAMADLSKRRHGVVYRFLRTIGVGEQTAARDAEGLEHHISGETLAALEQAIADLSRRE